MTVSQRIDLAKAALSLGLSLDMALEAIIGVDSSTIAAT